MQLELDFIMPDEDDPPVVPTNYDRWIDACNRMIETWARYARSFGFL